MQEHRSGLQPEFLIICLLLLFGIAYGILFGCSASSNREKASYESGIESNNIVKPPEIGEMIPTERALRLCMLYDLDYLAQRIKDHPDHYKEWKFDGCSMTPTEVLSEIIKVPSLTEICLRHDLGYAYGDPGNEEERLAVDRRFQLELLNAGAREFVAETMFKAVRNGGKEKFCLSFSWSYARAAPCKLGFGFKLIE